MYSERTLIISGSEKGLDGVIGFLKTCGCGSVAVVSSGSEARRMIPHDDYDLILINTPLKDEFGHQLAVKLCESTCSGVILICKADLAEEMVNRTGDYGVCVVSKPLNKQELVKALRIGSAFPAPSADDAKGEQQAPGKAGRDAVCFPCQIPAHLRTGHDRRGGAPLHRKKRHGHPAHPERSVPGSYRKIRINIVWKNEKPQRKEKNFPLRFYFCDFISLTLCRKYGRRHLPDPERYSPFRSGSRPRRRSRCQHPDALPAERHDPPGKPGCTGT